jgi:hypothetical protein
MELIKKTIKPFIQFVLFFIILLEELFWNIFEKASLFLEKYKFFVKLEDFIKTLSPEICLTLFLIPIGLMIPFKLSGLWFIGHGHLIYGIIVFTTAKITGTFLSARLFVITKYKLLQIYWFAMFFYTFEEWKNKVKLFVHETETYKLYLINKVIFIENTKFLYKKSIDFYHNYLK